MKCGKWNLGIATACIHDLGGSLVRVLTMKSTFLSSALRSYSLNVIVGSASAASLASDSSLIIAIFFSSCFTAVVLPLIFEDIVLTASRAAWTVVRRLVSVCAAILAVLPHVPMPLLMFGAILGGFQVL